MSGNTKVKIGVLAIQGSFAEHCAHVRRAGGEAVEVRKAEQLSGCHGLDHPRRGVHHHGEHLQALEPV